MERFDQSLSAQEWQQVKQWFLALMEVPADELPARLDGLTSDPRIKMALQAMLEVYHDAADLTITPKQSAADVLIQRHHLKPDDEFGRYRIVRWLGSGGVGDVYLAERQDEVVQQVAIKVLSPQSLDDHTQARFDVERRILASLEHPNIARLIDAGNHEGCGFYAMEYVAGMPINEHCVEHNLSVEQRLNLFLQLCDAVAYAHNSLIIHRDIKPSNILIDQAGQVKLLDFGIAKPLRHLPGANQLFKTSTHSVSLTPQYAAPEQLNSAVQNIGVGCDVYALGLLLYELLSNELVFDFSGMSWGQIEETILHRVPELPSKKVMQSEHSADSYPLMNQTTLAGRLKGDLDAIISQTLRKEINQRYTTVNAMAADIKHHLSTEPISIKGSQKGYVLRKFLRRNLLVVSASAVALVSLIGGLLVVLHQSNLLEQERDRALYEKQRAEQTSEFLTGLFRDADKTLEPGTELLAETVLAKGVEKLAREQLDERVKAGLQNTIARVYWNTGQYAKAQDLLDAIDWSNETLDTDVRAEALTMLGNLASNRRGQEASKQGIEYYQRALDLWGDNLYKLGDVNNKIGKAYEDLGDEAKASEQFDKVAAIIEQMPDKTHVNYAWLKRAYHDGVNRFNPDPKHLAAMEALIPLFVAEYGELHVDVADTYLMIANNYYFNTHPKQPSKSREYAQKAHHIFTELVGARYRQFTPYANLMALVEASEENYEKAVEYMRKTIEFESSLSGPESIGVAFLSFNMGDLLAYRLQRYTEAHELFVQAQEQITVHFGAQHPMAIRARLRQIENAGHIETMQAKADMEFNELMDFLTGLDEQHPSMGKAYYKYADFLLRTDQLTKAKGYLDRAEPLIIQHDGKQSSDYELWSGLVAQLAELEQNSQ